MDSEMIILKDIGEETPMRIEDGKIRCEWSNIGEGICGDYDPDDPNDVNLLRFDVYIRENGAWEAVDDASYCTQMPASTDSVILEKALRHIFLEYKDALDVYPHCSVKKLGERLSWISPDDFSENPEEEK